MLGNYPEPVSVVALKPTLAEVAADPERICSLLKRYILEMKSLVRKLAGDTMAECRAKRERQQARLEKLRKNSVRFWISILAEYHKADVPSDLRTDLEICGVSIATATCPA